MHRLHGGRAIVAAALAFSGLLVLVAPAGAVTRDAVVVLPTTGVVDPIMADYLSGAVRSSADGGARAVVIELNTPGGSLDSTQKIVSAILEARVPVIVWVAPSGGYAASAGTFITLAANLAFMAPGTRIGAASPIDSSGQDIPGTLGEKVKNDAIAWITSIAEVRNRPIDWAVSTVASARSSPANEAVSLGAVDGIATTIDEVVRLANGKTVTVSGAPVTLDLTNAPISNLAINPLEGILHLLVDPNIAFILFVVGALAVLFELQNPNLVTGVLGGLAILLSFVGFGSLPLNAAGLLLVGTGIVLFALEPFITSHGLLTVAGIVCLVLGASALYTQSGPFEPDLTVARELLISVAAAGAAFGVLISVTAVRTRTMAAPAVALPSVVASGTVGEVRRPLEPLGSIYAGGEEWSARTADDRPLPRGTPVRVVGHYGLTVLVEPAPPSAA